MGQFITNRENVLVYSQSMETWQDQSEYFWEVGSIFADHGNLSKFGRLSSTKQQTLLQNSTLPHGTIVIELDASFYKKCVLQLLSSAVLWSRKYQVLMQCQMRLSGTVGQTALLCTLLHCSPVSYTHLTLPTKA